ADGAVLAAEIDRQLASLTGDRALREPESVPVASAQPRTQRHCAPQVQMRAVLEGETDATKHLYAGLRDAHLTVQRERAGDIGGVVALTLLNCDGGRVPGHGRDGLDVLQHRRAQVLDRLEAS